MLLRRFCALPSHRLHTLNDLREPYVDLNNVVGKRKLLRRLG